MADNVTTFLMFEGRAEEAMDFYVSLFPGAEVLRRERDAASGRLGQGAFLLNGREFRCFDSPVAHGFTFTPAMSIFVDCGDEAELERLFAALSDGGGVLMPLGDYGFSRRFGWTNDRFGVSWQINLPHAQ
jgi:predicted 3-demethylubiquinone-9 3-methyltransferase (glyoxalase superfamily)